MVFHLVLAEVRRLHPGFPSYDDAADHIVRLREEADSVRGRDALQDRACEELRPMLRDVLLEVAEFGQ